MLSDVTGERDVMECGSVCHYYICTSVLHILAPAVIYLIYCKYSKSVYDILIFPMFGIKHDYSVG